jgi:hypothetical protein
MRKSNGVRARRIPVPGADLAFAGIGRHDYADSYELRLPIADQHSAEQWVRAALEHAPRAARWTIRAAQTHVLRLRLGPHPSAGHVFGWPVAEARTDAMRLETWSPLIGRAVIVLRRPDPASASVTTFLVYARPTAARVAWSAVGPVHRFFAGHLLEHAAAVLGQNRRLRPPAPSL